MEIEIFRLTGFTHPTICRYSQTLPHNNMTSQATIDPPVLSILDTPRAAEYFPFSDTEIIISQSDNESVNPAALNVACHVNFPSDPTTPIARFITGCSRQPMNGGEEKNGTAATPPTKKKPWCRGLPIPSTNIPPRKRAKI
ncbi:hypothetical protein HOY80DRAFT_1135657 [Tuber brumale]|nr:hypothetical protein HOY80DRAFT_1135657 [Tuber brumale]